MDKVQSILRTPSVNALRLTSSVQCGWGHHKAQANVWPFPRLQLLRRTENDGKKDGSRGCEDFPAQVHDGDNQGYYVGYRAY